MYKGQSSWLRHRWIHVRNSKRDRYHVYWGEHCKRVSISFYMLLQSIESFTGACCDAGERKMSIERSIYVNVAMFVDEKKFLVDDEIPASRILARRITINIRIHTKVTAIDLLKLAKPLKWKFCLKRKENNICVLKLLLHHFYVDVALVSKKPGSDKLLQLTLI